LEFASRFILEQIGIEPEEEDKNYLDIMLARFGENFPTTKEFSNFARETLKNINFQDNPDDILLAWIEREEILFRTLERHLIGDHLQNGFNNDVDSFMEFALKVQNRRKSRAGRSLENHIEYLFRSNGIQFSRGEITENKSKPDFIFPTIANYRDIKFPTERLTMLGVKTTCKDRWRQILAEADRITEKHLLTLEPRISQNQTNEMQQKKIQLVLPKNLHSTYIDEQQKWLMSVFDFMRFVHLRQAK
jgi:hypothetical protein